MAFRYLGTQARIYTQYLDAGTSRPLVAEPGGSYGMVPVQSAGDLPVPPGDGLWEPADGKPAKTRKPAAPAAGGSD